MNNRERMDALVGTMRDLLNTRSGYYFSWTADVFDDGHLMPRVDRTHLHVVYLSADGPRYKLINPCIAEEMRSKVVYSARRSYRVTSGIRRGHVILEGDLLEQETYVQSGLSKELTVGNKGYFFNPTKKADIASMDFMEGIYEAEDVEDMSEMTPEVFITVRDKHNLGNMQVRDTAAAIHMVEQCPDYRGDVASVLDDFSVDAGQGRVALPYKYFVGRGVLVCDYAEPVFGKWFHARDLNTANNQMILADFKLHEESICL